MVTSYISFLEQREKLTVGEMTLAHARPSSPPLPTAKRKRRRKVSSSNESTTSEALSYISEPQVGTYVRTIHTVLFTCLYLNPGS